MQNLNPMMMPLVGASLIEASAGTGKTYTITALYLRLILGFNQDNKERNPIPIDKILVVTFTEAATAEIKDRVNKRLNVLRDRLLGQVTDDDVVNKLYDLIEDKKEAFNLIDSAVKSLDDAAIFTIHGFCQRMLKQNAFESGIGFDLTFIMDQVDLLETAIKDFWRKTVFPLDKQDYSAVTKCFKSPQQLLKSLYGLLVRHGAKVTPDYSLPQAFSLQHQLKQQTSILKKEIIEQNFIEFIQNSPFKKSKPIANKNLSRLQSYCESNELIFKGASDKSFEIWRTEEFVDQTNYTKNAMQVSHPLTALFDELSELSKQYETALPVALLSSAFDYVTTWLVNEKQKNQLINPDDLLTNLSKALNKAGSDSLAQAIREQYPVALIDEFQDTDPIQYDIFSKIYLSGTEHSSNAPALIMIGDPKQAIYGFRGADIFTYIDAKHHIPPDTQYTLNTNYRSSSQLVSSVNSLFSHKSNSFIFNKDIPFQPVDSYKDGQASGLTHFGKVKQGMHFCVLDELDKTLAKGPAEEKMAMICANEIAELLNGAQQQQTCIGDELLKAGDIAILVRDRSQASLIKSALKKCGILSVYLSRDSVFKTSLATHFLSFLSGLLSPYNEAALRGFLIGPLFSLDYHAVAKLTQDGNLWEETVTQFEQLKSQLLKQGVLAVVETLVSNNQLPTRWHSKGWDVPRMLTDLRHLGELLQQKQMELNSYHRLLTWFSDCINEMSSEGSQLRLETDQQLINIITMHGSKGLEYPLVFMPFATSFKANNEAVYHSKNKELIYDLAPSDDTQELADKEALAEDLRLLYVALTRPVHYLFVGMYHIKDGRKDAPGIAKTSLGHLLFDFTNIETGEQWYAQLSQFCNDNKGMDCALKAVPKTLIKISEQPIELEALSVKECQSPVANNWRLSSFSSITKSNHANTESFDFKQGALDENHQLDWTGSSLSEQLDEFSFPKGANPGSCLHAIMEDIDFNCPHRPKFMGKRPINDVIEEQLKHYHIDQKWLNPVSDWVGQLLSEPLAPLNFALSDLDMEQCLIEMEFMLPVNDLLTDKLNLILVKQGLTELAPLSSQTISGLLKGFIDLIFCHKGRYYVLDYKSNYLGEKGDDYNLSNMEAVMSSHYYHLQYLLYTVALNRMLKLRMPNYNIEEHLGGSIYLFLRGMPSGKGIYYKQLNVALINELDDLFEQGTSNA